jgi:hypothetical protein
MRAHVLTACTRPQNLDLVAESIMAATCDPWDVTWHIRFDPEQQHVGGQRLKNEMLDQIEDGWVCFLDDDTTMHPEFLRRMAEAVADAGAVVVSQQRQGGHPFYGGVLVAAHENLQVGSVDIGQAFIARSLIGPHRIPEDYEGDGMFLNAVLANWPAVAYLPDVLSEHNALEAVAV